MWLSIIADNNECADVIAWKSPVKCRFISSIGTICAYPPPAAPPFIPKFGPKDASRIQIIAFLPMRFKPSPRPTVVVVLPSPAGVGLMAVTKINLPFSRSCNELMNSWLTFALSCPYGKRSFASMPNFAPISKIGFLFASRAISISVLKLMSLVPCVRLGRSFPTWGGIAREIRALGRNSDISRSCCGERSQFCFPSDTGFHPVLRIWRPFPLVWDVQAQPIPQPESPRPFHPGRHTPQACSGRFKPFARLWVNCTDDAGWQMTGTVLHINRDSGARLRLQPCRWRYMRKIGDSAHNHSTPQPRRVNFVQSDRCSDPIYFICAQNADLA